MTSKGNQTRDQILQAAKRLFIKKGYAAVSMSDLCSATGLSRGGLYRHFSSTDEIFSALLTADKDGWEEGLNTAMNAGVSAIQMLKYFFAQLEQDISENVGRLSLATYEFELSGQERLAFLQGRYESATRMMERLLRYGQERGELCIPEPRLEAEQLTIYLEGLKLASAGISFSAEMVARQLEYLLNKLIQNGGGTQ